jgi:hypothetical protein
LATKLSIFAAKSWSGQKIGVSAESAALQSIQEVEVFIHNFCTQTLRSISCPSMLLSPAAGSLLFLSIFPGICHGATGNSRLLLCSDFFGLIFLLADAQI